MTLDALIFDVDGTLADTERDGHRLAYNAAFSDAGLDWHWSPELYGELLEITGGKERIAHYLARWRHDFEAPPELDAFIARLHAVKTRHYTQLLRTGGIALRAGVTRVIAEARAAGLRLAIATTTTPANVEVLIDTTLGHAARAWFDVIGAGDIVAAKKPAPDIYYYVLARLGLAPARCLALEDSANGLRAALAAGIPCVVTVNDYTRTQDFAGAAAVLDGFGDTAQPARVRDDASGTLGQSVVVDVAALRRLHAVQRPARSVSSECQYSSPS
jgi:HAD superfamily hydrolase (TIGR01509 family)